MMKEKDYQQNLKKECLIEIVSTQRIDGDTDKIVVTTKGTYFKAPTGNYFIQYKEYNDDEYSSFETTTIKISENQIFITRKGEHPSTLLLENEKHHICHYCTPFGNIFIGIFTHKLDFDFTQDSFRISAEYTLDFDGEVASKNTFTIKTVQQKNEGKKI